MEEIFLHEDPSKGAKIVVLSKDQHVGISTAPGTLIALGPAETAELYEALGKHIARNASK